MRPWLWRLGSFLLEWGRLVAWGDSLAGRVLRFIAFLAGLGLMGVLTERVTVMLWTPGGFWFSWETAVGFLLAVGLVFVGVVVAAGAAWSRTPMLWVSDRLGEDRAHRYVRLQVKNRAAGQPRGQAHLMEVVDDAGNSLLASTLLPLELHWTDHPEERPELPPGIPKSIGVAHLSIEGMIRFEGMNAPRLVSSRSVRGEPRTVWFQVRVNIFGKRKHIMRWFGLEPSSDPVLYHRSLSGPPPFLRRRSIRFWKRA